MHHNAKNAHYMHLAIMAVLSFISMYILMYAMVNTFDNVYSNWSQAYMAGLMTAPMVAIELLVMRGMYDRKKWNVMIVAGSVVVGVLCFVLIRQQTAVGDAQLLRSMIPHHAGAILMCGKANLADDEVRALCRSILESQQREIDLMKAKLKRL